MWQIEFSSAQFLPYLPEDCQSNPGVYGFELAHWLSQALAKQGVVTGYPVGEDWGWLIEFLEDETEIAIGCASRTEAGEGYTGHPVTWVVFIEPRFSFKRWLQGGSTAVTEERLAQAITAALVAAGIA